MIAVTHIGRQNGLPEMGPLPAVPAMDLYNVDETGSTFAVEAGAPPEVVQAAAAEALRTWRAAA